MTVGTTFEDDIDAEDFDDVVNELVRLGIAKMQVGSVAVVVSYDETRGSCSCRPVVRGGVKGSTVGLKWPVISNVPVRFPAGGNFSLTYPIVAGDFVWLDFGDRSLDDWQNSGQSDVTPASKRRFHISDAVAYPGVRPFSKPLKNATTDALVIGQDEYDGLITNPGLISEPLQLRIDPAGIRLGDGGASNDVLNVLSDLMDLLLAATTTIASFGTPTPLLFTDPALVAIKARIDAIRKP